MTKDELKMLGILQWEDIKHKYPKINLLLGNGFSMGISSTFSYGSLFKNFLDKCDPTHQSLFNQFGTTNFELILDYLAYSVKVNTIFGIDTTKINNAIEILRNGLIESINDVHPNKSSIDWAHIDRITDSLQDFNDIYTTNYDLFLYHIIMKSIDKHRMDSSHRPYQDYFWGDYSTEFKEFKGYQMYSHYKHVYYLHGSLFLFNRNIVDVKIKLNNVRNEILDLITNRINANDFPFFVSEGSALDKKDSISRNNYLTFCLNKLEQSNKSILVYGHSLGDVDAHILAAMVKKPKDIIIAIHPDGKSDIQLKSIKYAFLSKFNHYSKAITLIDSNSLFS